MAPPTVGEFKSMLNAIPGGAQAAQIVPSGEDDGSLLVVQNWRQTADGSTFFDAIGRLDVVNKQYVPF